RSSSALENAMVWLPLVTTVHGPTSWSVGPVTTSGATARSSAAGSRGPRAIAARLARLAPDPQQVRAEGVLARPRPPVASLGYASDARGHGSWRHANASAAAPVPPGTGCHLPRPDAAVLPRDRAHRRGTRRRNARPHVRVQSSQRADRSDPRADRCR